MGACGLSLAHFPTIRPSFDSDGPSFSHTNQNEKLFRAVTWFFTQLPTPSTATVTEKAYCNLLWKMKDNMKQTSRTVLFASYGMVSN